MAVSYSGAPTLPAISQTPLLSGDLGIPGDLFAAFAGPLPIITIGTSTPATFGDDFFGAPSSSSPSSPGPSRPSPAQNYRGRSRFNDTLQLNLKPRSASSSPYSSAPSSPVSPRSVSSLWNLLEDMQKDVDLEVQRVRRGIHETRMLVQAYREDSAARETARRERLAKPRGRQMARG